ncbi:MAG: M16 family metallopeptidase [Thermoanaerobaculia bacterium]
MIQALWAGAERAGRLAAFSLLAGLLAPRGGWAAAPIHISYTKKVLENGLTVVLHEDHRLPVAAVNILYRVGSADEKPGRSGFAHLFEHLMFTGSAHVENGRFDRLLESAGGENNATTRADSTDYFELVPSNALELPLYLDGDRMATLGQAITREKFETQRSVVENERREDIDNRPYGTTEETLLAHLFPPGHPYHLPVIGTMKDLDAATLADVRAFFSEHYTPNNAILSIAGDFDSRRVGDLVEKYFGAIPRGPISSPPRPAPVEVPSEIRLRLEDRVELPRLTLAWVTPANLEPGDAALDVLARVLTGDKTSRLYRRLVYEMQIAQDVSAGQDSQSLASLFTISVTARPGHSLSEIEPVVEEELGRLTSEAPSATEILRARSSIEASFLRRLERIGGIADQLAEYEATAGDPDFFQKDLDRYESLKPEDIRDAAALLSENHRVVLSVVPNGKLDLASWVQPRPRAKAAGVVPVDWNVVPSPGPAPEVRLPAVRRKKLSNGLSVWILEQHALPIVRADLVVPAGSEEDPRDEAGLARMAAAMLSRGTETRSALDLSGQASLLGAELGAGAGWDSSFVTLDVPSARWGDGLDLLADVALHPAFRLDELERVKKGTLAALQQQVDEPEAVAGAALERTVYGSGHPYGRSDQGVLRSVARIQAGDVRSFYRKAFEPAGAVLIVVGDVSAESAFREIEKRFGSWKGEGGKAAPVRKPASAPSRLILIDKPGAAQSAIEVGRIGVARSTPDFFSIEVMNTILGGSFTSRLNQNLREVHGYAYGAGSGFAMRRGAGPFAAEASVQTDSTAPALREMLSELRRITVEKPAEAELEKAKNYLALSFPQTLETPGDLARRLATVFLFSLPEDYYDRFVSRVEAVTAQDVLRAAQETLAGDFVIVVVGDLARIRPEIEKLGVGAIEIAKYDPETGDVVPVK